MIEDKKIDTPVDSARLIREVLAELGWMADPAEVARSVRRLDIGLAAEDEFSVVCAWLGRCELLHKLDQQQVPVASRAKFQVPDLLARFTTQINSAPVLIEVKSKRGNTLSFQPDYLERLIKYSELVGMPLLIAWKYHSMWTLFEVKHLRKAKKNFNIALSDAARENLLGMLAGDVAYKIGAGAGIHLRLRKDRLISTENSDMGWTEQWQMTLDDVAFSNYEGTRLTDLGTDVQALFTAWDLEDNEVHTESHIYQRFIAGHEGMQFAHMALVRLIKWDLPDADPLHWRSLLRKEQVVANIAIFSTALENAFRQKIVSHIYHLQPHSVPPFLPAVERGAAE